MAVMARYDVGVTRAVGECGEATSHRVRARCPEAAYESVRRAAAGDWQDVVPTRCAAAGSTPMVRWSASRTCPAERIVVGG